jgi:pimeloyl-ACP methyl ester carboxylesterase
MLAVGASALTACAAMIASRIVEPPPSRIERSASKHALDQAGLVREFLRRDGAPRLSYVVVEPGDYGLRYEFRSSFGLWTWRLDYRAPPRPPQPPRGTVILLHGWSVEALTNLHWALALAERGYRSVLLDLRNHGRSGRGASGWGMREAQDVAALVAHLDAQRRVTEPLTVLGVSLGAVSAMHYAAAEPRVRALVALEPFANAADAVKSSARGLANESVWWFVDEADLDRAIDRAGRSLGIDLRTLDTRALLARVGVCAVVLHGQRDRLIPVDATRDLGRGQPNVQRYELPWDGHFSTPARLDILADPVAAWLDAAAQATPDACPEFRFYPYAPTHGVRNALAKPW